jgi:hypothetical protein
MSGAQALTNEPQEALTSREADRARAEIAATLVAILFIAAGQHLFERHRPCGFLRSRGSREYGAGDMHVMPIGPIGRVAENPEARAEAMRRHGYDVDVDPCVFYLVSDIAVHADLLVRLATGKIVAPDAVHACKPCRCACCGAVRCGAIGIVLVNRAGCIRYQADRTDRRGTDTGYSEVALSASA